MTESDTTPLVARVTRLDADLTTGERLTVAFLAESDGGHTRPEIAAATGLSNAAGTLSGLRDVDLVERRERLTDGAGRNPYVYELTAATRSALDVETPEWTHDTVRPRIIRELAEIHYERGCSSAKSKRLAREIPGASTQYVASRLGSLATPDGPVECVKRTGKAEYRLVGAGLYTPYRALRDAAATDGGTDR